MTTTRAVLSISTRPGSTMDRMGLFTNRQEMGVEGMFRTRNIDKTQGMFTDKLERINIQFPQLTGLNICIIQKTGRGRVTTSHPLDDDHAYLFDQLDGNTSANCSITLFSPHESESDCIPVQIGYRPLTVIYERPLHSWKTLRRFFIFIYFYFTIC